LAMAKREEEAELEKPDQSEEQAEKPNDSGRAPVPAQDPRLALAEEAFARYLRTKWVPPVTCPICQTNDWSFGAPVDMPIRFRQNRAYTMFPVWCNNCRYTIFFQGVLAGLFDKEGDPVIPEVEPEEPPPESAEEPEASGPSSTAGEESKP
jgi:hypothetical protein